MTDDLPENWRDLDGIGSYEDAIAELRRRHVANEPVHRAPPWPLLIELAGAPRGKGAVRPTIRFGGKLHVFQPTATKDYQAALRYTAQQAMAGAPPTAGAVQVEILAAIPVPPSWSARKRADALAGRLHPTKKPDVDNFAKACDALNGVVWLDDKQIVHETIIKVYAAAPSLRVTVRPIGDD